MKVDIEFIQVVESTEKIKMIKLIRSECQMELKAAKELVEEVTNGPAEASARFTVSVGDMDEIRVINQGIAQNGFAIKNLLDIEKIFGDIETEFKQFIQRAVELEKMALAADLCGVYAKHYRG